MDERRLDDGDDSESEGQKTKPNGLSIATGTLGFSCAEEFQLFPRVSGSTGI